MADPGASPPITFARDLARHAGRVRLAGKLLATGERTWLVSDAFCRAPIELSVEERRAQIGDWVVVEGHAQHGRVTDAVLVVVYPGTLPGLGEFARFSRVAVVLERLALAKRVVRDWFDQQGFIEVVTPIRVAAPGTDPSIEPLAATGGWLITSPELQMKRMLAGGFTAIYQFAPCTRREEVGLWHQPEFTLLEWYQSFAEVEQTLSLTERLVCWVATALQKEEVTVGAQRVELRPPFERLTVRQAFARFAGIDDAAALCRTDEDRYFRLLVECVEPALARSSRPVFLTDYPASQAALARVRPDDPEVAERFELYLGGVELCNGYGELTAPDEQRARFERDREVRRSRGAPDLPLDEALLAAMIEGLPPCSGNALGFERLIALLLEVPLADVVSFPRAIRS